MLLEKRCNRCEAIKAIAEFPKNPDSPDGYYSLCKPCRAEKSKAYRGRPDVKAKEAERLAAQYQRNRDALLASRKARYARKRDHEMAVNAAWRARNLGRHRAMLRKWAKDNPVAMRAIIATRRARKAAAGGTYTRADVLRMLESQEGKCLYCAVVLDTFHVDHIVPLSRGGTNDPGNLQVLCPTCNRRKGAKLPDEFAGVHR